MLVPITEAIKSKALAMNKQVLAALPKGTNYTKLNHPERFFIGYVGELCTIAAFRQLNVSFRYQPRTDGRADSGDLQVKDAEGRILCIDVKTASNVTHEYLMMPTAQYLRHQGGKADFILAARVETDHCRLFGLCSREDFARFSIEKLPGDKTRPRVHVPTRIMNLRAMPMLFSDVPHFFS